MRIISINVQKLYSFEPPSTNIDSFGGTIGTDRPYLLTCGLLQLYTCDDSLQGVRVGNNIEESEIRVVMEAPADAHMTVPSLPLYPRKNQGKKV